MHLQNHTRNKIYFQDKNFMVHLTQLYHDINDI